MTDRTDPPLPDSYGQTRQTRPAFYGLPAGPPEGEGSGQADLRKK